MSVNIYRKETDALEKVAGYGKIDTWTGTQAEFDALDKSTLSDNCYINITDDLAFGGEEYSTSEIVVGKWIDGKPIYRRVFQHSESQLVSQSEWTQLPSGQYPTGLVRVIHCHGCGLNGSAKPLLATLDGRVLSPRNGNIAEDLFMSIWEYTKQSDYN